MSAQDNINIIRAWIDAHNRRDMNALDYMDEDVEIVVPTGVTHKGFDVMRKLAEMAYSRGGWKDITNIFASEDEACVEYNAKGNLSEPLSESERKTGIHGIDLSSAKPAAKTIELKVCFVCHFKNGKIDRAREYWDTASLMRQMGVDNPRLLPQGVLTTDHIAKK
jgi:ketosteroid isomerase-like protein